MEQIPFKTNEDSDELEKLKTIKTTLLKKIREKDISNIEEQEEKFLQLEKRIRTLESNNAIEKMAQPLKHILEQIHPSIENGEHTTIIGDDASGRAPTLILNNIIKTVYSQNHKKPPQVLFIGGAGNSNAENYYTHKIDRELKKKNIDDHLNKYLDNKSGKVLIVTDYIETGVSLRSLIRSLDDIGSPHEIVTLSTGESTNLTNLEEKLGKIHDGKDKGVPEIYRKDAIAGVIKNPNTVLSNPAIYEGRIESANEVSDTREKLADLTHNLLEYYKTL